MSKNSLLFVYGTLKNGYGNNVLLRTSDFLFAARTKDPVFDMIGKNRGFPYVLQGGKSFIKGEVFSVADDGSWEDLDALEGVPDHFNRVEVDVIPYDVHEHSDPVRVNMYVAGERIAEQIRRRESAVFDTPNNDNILSWGNK